jgi:hypothetical protein
MAERTSTGITDMTVDELRKLIREVVMEALDQHEAQQETKPSVDPRGLLDIPPVSVGSWPEGLKLISRNEFYDDNDPDGR